MTTTFYERLLANINGVVLPQGDETIAGDVSLPVETVPDSFHVPTLVNTEQLIPRPYQIDGSRFLAQHKRALLTDAPGLGKTLTAASAAVPPCLVIAPTYLTRQWFDFLTKQYPDDRVILAEGTRLQRQADLDVAYSKGYEWLIINIQMLRNYDIQPATTIIIDESHHIRKNDTQQSKAAVKLAKKCEYAFLLTATPIVRNPDDLFMQLHTIDSTVFPSYWQFLRDYCNTISSPYGPRVIGARSHVLRNIMEKYAIGRSYDDVQMQLPELLNKVIRVPMSSELRKVYTDIKNKYVFQDQDVNSLMEAMHLMRRVTSQAKLEHALEILIDLPEEDGAIIFCWYTKLAEHLGQLLKCPVITGATPPNDRKKIAQDRSNKWIIGTLASISEGIDLSHMRHVLFFEADYLPGRLYQALSRVRRHGGHSSVNVTYLVVEKSIDEVIHSYATTRNATIKEIMKEALL